MLEVKLRKYTRHRLPEEVIATLEVLWKEAIRAGEHLVFEVGLLDFQRGTDLETATVLDMRVRLAYDIADAVFVRMNDGTRRYIKDKHGKADTFNKEARQNEKLRTFKERYANVSEKE